MKKPSFALLAVLALISAVVIWKANSPQQQGRHKDSEQTTSKPNSKPSPRDPGGAAAGDASPQDPTSPTKDGSAENPPRVTKVRDRDKPNFDAKRLATVDMSLPPDEATPQQGPQLFAELRTLSKRHVNLAPNHLGIMPRIRVAPREPMLVTLTLPDASPGDRLVAELSDGGRFDDIEEPGRVYTIGKSKTVEIRFEASEQAGHCNLAILQNGHSRTLPLWVGAVPELATGDPE